VELALPDKEPNDPEMPGAEYYENFVLPELKKNPRLEGAEMEYNTQNQ
jgi:hypothetical protein